MLAEAFPSTKIFHKSKANARESAAMTHPRDRFSTRALSVHLTACNEMIPTSTIGT